VHTPRHDDRQESNLSDSQTTTDESMSSSNPIHSPRADERRSLRDRIADILRPSSPGWILRSNNHAEAGRSSDFDPSSNLDGVREPDDRSRLLEDYNRSDSVCGLRECNHGTFSPRAEQHDSDSSHDSAFPWGLRTLRGVASGIASGARTPGADGVSVTKRLALEHGVKHHRTMYVNPFGL
jgi:hypothetical protein